ncbi:hypothetical protein LG307_15985 [Sutcliffiella horikoshii]|uniref:hypothetical protein n=1 Tax=Sutcliffiella horikoshii TaxID=79883 RepID=UPI00384F2049
MKFWFGQLLKIFGQIRGIFGQLSENFGQNRKIFGHLLESATKHKRLIKKIKSLSAVPDPSSRFGKYKGCLSLGSGTLFRPIEATTTLLYN